MPESESKPGFFGKIGGIFGKRSKSVEIEAPKSLDLQKKIAEKVSLNEQEICDLANDLVENGVKSSVARAKILSQTGQNTIEELLTDREIIPKDLQVVANLSATQEKVFRDWMKKTGKKALVSTAVGGVLTLLTGGSGALLAAGLVGSTLGSGAVEFFRARSEKKFKAEEVKEIIKNIQNSKKIALELLMAKKEAASDTEGAPTDLNNAIAKFINSVQTNSQEALSARAKLFEKGHLKKWAWLSFGASITGAIAGVGAWNALHGFLALKTEAATHALKEAKTSGITTQQLAEHGVKGSTHDIGFRDMALRVEGAKETVETTNGYFGYVINSQDLATKAFQDGYPLTGVDSAGGLVYGTQTLGTVHHEVFGQQSINTISKIGGMVNEYIAKEALEKAGQQVSATLASIAAGIMSGEIAGQRISGGEKRQYQQAKTNIEIFKEGLEPTAHAYPLGQPASADGESQTQPLDDDSVESPEGDAGNGIKPEFDELENELAGVAGRKVAREYLSGLFDSSQEKKVGGGERKKINIEVGDRLHRRSDISEVEAIRFSPKFSFEVVSVTKIIIKKGSIEKIEYSATDEKGEEVKFKISEKDLTPRNNSLIDVFLFFYQKSTDPQAPAEVADDPTPRPSPLASSVPAPPAQPPAVSSTT